MTVKKAQAFSERVIAWQLGQGRHHLPWQHTRDAYRVWLSEIMLQQTQVSAVLVYYQRFLEALPTVVALANAPHEQVMSLWAGLGYYTRARNLHACAKVVCEQYDGIFPDDVALLAQLPGIGRSTAGAIAAFAYAKCAAILDGNVKRVFARHFAVDGYPGAAAIEKQMWLLAESLLPADGIEAYTQGIMDLGATLCVRGAPSCQLCPLQTTCQALAQGRVHELPVPKPKVTRPVEYWTVGLILCKNKIWLQRRPLQGIWGGLWMAPMQQNVAPPECLTLSGALRALRWREWGLPLTHDLTHKRLVIQAAIADIGPDCALNASSGDWYDWPLKPDAPVPAPLQKLSLQYSRGVV